MSVTVRVNVRTSSAVVSFPNDTRINCFASSTEYPNAVIVRDGSCPFTRHAILVEIATSLRLINEHPDKDIVSLNPNLCPCMTMNRITLPYLLWSLESIESAEYIHEIKVDDNIARHARLALNRMFENV